MEADLADFGYTDDRGAYVDYIITQESGGNAALATEMFDTFMEVAVNTGDGLGLNEDETDSFEGFGRYAQQSFRGRNPADLCLSGKQLVKLWRDR